MAAWRLGRIRLIEGGLFQLRYFDEKKNIEREYADFSSRNRLAYLYLHDVRGPNALATLGRYEARAERSFYRALRELQRLQTETTKQTQSAPEPEQPQDFTPPSNPSFVPLCLCGEPQSPLPSPHHAPPSGTMEDYGSHERLILP